MKLNSHSKDCKDTDFDVVVIGAGAAGIGAARHLRQHGLKFMVLEAMDRVGGRAWTVPLANGCHMDLGCHWLHSASLNPLVWEADRLGIRYQVRTNDPFEIWGPDGPLPASEMRAYLEYSESVYVEFAQMANRPCDAPISTAVPGDERWQGLFYDWMRLLTSTEASQASLQDFMGYYDSGEDFPVRDGYGRLISVLAGDLPITLNCPVTDIHWGRNPVRIRTARGEIRARHVIVTVSTAVLRHDTLDFNPKLPDAKRTAIECLPLGHYDRVIAELSDNPFSRSVPEYIRYTDFQDTHVFMGIRPHDQNLLVWDFAGDMARDLQDRDSEAFALMENWLTDLFGSDIRQTIQGYTRSAWGREAWIGGAYSAAMPGQSHQRQVLAEPVSDRLFFAGEATCSEFYATAHGAYLSGQAAATRICEMMGP